MQGNSYQRSRFVKRSNDALKLSGLWLMFEWLSVLVVGDLLPYLLWRRLRLGYERCHPSFDLFVFQWIGICCMRLNLASLFFSRNAFFGITTLLLAAKCWSKGTTFSGSYSAVDTNLICISFRLNECFKFQSPYFLNISLCEGERERKRPDMDHCSSSHTCTNVATFRCSDAVFAQRVFCFERTNAVQISRWSAHRMLAQRFGEHLWRHRDAWLRYYRMGQWKHRCSCFTSGKVCCGCNIAKEGVRCYILHLAYHKNALMPVFSIISVVCKCYFVHEE